MSARTSLRVATDVGGTFTDLVCLQTDPSTGAQQVVCAKADTTPPHFEQGVMDVLRAARVTVPLVAQMVHGTTVVINALTERRGARTALLTTAGFRDVLEIARGNRPDYFNLHYRKPEPFVPRYLRRELPGRLAVDGSEREPLDLRGLPAILDEFRRHGVEAVAVCLLHAYANPAHEREVVQAVRRLWPAFSVVASHQITREWREYERSNTTVLCAYVQPAAQRYLSHLEKALVGAGFAGGLYIMQSNCGVDSVQRTAEIPIAMVESGPASGFHGAAELARVLGEHKVLALDIGGTTAKCCLIERGQVRVATDYWIERSRTSAGYPIMVPVVDLVEIGNGGGSIASVDEFGKLHVGPRSAGARPGPAAYGRGGLDATTTDASLALGRINPGFFCGGTVRADMAAVGTALDRIATRLGTTREQAARGIVRIANHNMVNALKLVSLNRGYDTREFTLIAFGGGGALHAVELARELGMPKVIVPRAAHVFSAWGMLMSDLRRDFFVTQVLPLDADSAPALEALLREVEQHAVQQYAEEGIAADRVRTRRLGRMRYQNQEHTVEVALADGAFDATAVRDAIDSFKVAYRQEYTYTLDAPVELIGVHVVVQAEVGKLELPRMPTGAGAPVPREGAARAVDFGEAGVHEARVYDADSLPAGSQLCGPAVLEGSGTVIVVHPGNRVVVDDYGNFHIALTEVPA